MNAKFRAAAVAGLLLGLGANAAGAGTLNASGLPNEDDRRAPVDRGFGPGVDPPKPAQPAATGSRRAPLAAPDAPAASPVPPGGAAAAAAGVFGAPVATPVIPIHAVLLPDGRVLSYGTDEAGKQGGQFVYDIWDPSLGTGPAAHWVLPNTTRTDIFCSGQSVLPGDGRVLIVGGDLTVDGRRNHSIGTTALLDPVTGAMRAGAPMAYRRWYPSLVATADGRMVALGGRQDPTNRAALVPEVFTPATGWRKLPGAASEAAYGGVGNAWFYPKTFLKPDGRLFVVSPGGQLFDLDIAGPGTLREWDATVSVGSNFLPTLMFAPGRILSLRSERRVAVLDVNGPEPTVRSTASVGQKRLWANATVLADGKVLVTGGSGQPNQLVDVAYAAELWDPATGAWTRGASAAKPRLYHSTALLLPDGSVYTGGGGAPGPVRNLNAEIYYPPYLYAKDGSGLPARRPKLVAAPDNLRLGQAFDATVAGGRAIRRVTLVRTGSVTHSFNADQRFIELRFDDSAGELRVDMPTDRHVAVPGFYLLFVFDAAGTPSVAKIVRVSA